MSKKFVCEKCGSSALIEDSDFLKCSDCGTLVAIIGSPYWADWALNNRPASPTVFAKAFFANGKRSEKRLALEIDKYFEPRPAEPSTPTPPEISAALAEIAHLGPSITSDEGQRAYTEAEVKELLELEQERVIAAFANQGIYTNGPMMDRIMVELREANHKQAPPEKQQLLCRDCGRDHSEQRELLPVGLRVVSVSGIKKYNGVLPIGTRGEVKGHTDDGRAIVEFEGDSKAGHTFHVPENFLTWAVEHA